MKTPEAPDEMSGVRSPGAPASSGRGAAPAGWLAGPSVFDHRDSKKLGAGFGLSLALHGIALVVILAIFSLAPAPQTIEPPLDMVRLVYMQQPGPGGGGGGSPAPAPPKPIEVPRVKATPPVPVTVPPPVPPPPKPPPQLNAPVMTNNQELVQATGVSAISLARLGGEGRGQGIGAGRGSGVGPGEGGGVGGGAYRPGNGLVNPVLIRQEKPAYTPEAMRARIQGTVVLEAIVLDTGRIGEVKIMKSLDRATGLDEEAIKAARRWLFKPATDRQGKTVAMWVQLELEFRLH